MTNATKRDGHAADAGVIVVPKAQGGLDEFYEVRMVWEEGVLPERSERFSARGFMQFSRLCSVEERKPRRSCIFGAKHRA